MITSVDVSGADAPLNLPLWGYEDGFYIKEITGLGPVSAEFSTSSRARFDGLRLQNVRKGVRNIVMTVGLLTGHHTRTVESLRHQLYLSYPVGQEVNLTINREGLQDLHITGVVESVEDAIFSREPEMVVSVVCMNPYYRVGEPNSHQTAYDRNLSKDLVIDYEGNVPGGIRIWLQVSSLSLKDGFEVEFESDRGLATFYADNGSYYSVVDLDTRGLSRKFIMQNQPALHTVWSGASWPELYRGYNSVSVTAGGIQSGTGSFRVIFQWDVLQDYA